MSKERAGIFMIQFVEEYAPWNELPFFGCCDMCYYFMLHYTYIPRCSTIYHIHVFDTLFMNSLHKWLKSSNTCTQLVNITYDSVSKTKRLYMTIHSDEYKFHLQSIEDRSYMYI